MPFVERDQGGTIVGVYARPQPGRAEEHLAEDHADLIAWRAAKEARDAEPGEFETLIEMLREGDPAWDAKIAAARQRIIDRRP